MNALFLIAVLAAPERLVVGLRDGDLWTRHGDARAKDLARAARGIEVRRLTRALVIDVPDTRAAVRALSARGDVAYIEREVFFEVRLKAVPDDPLYADQWHLHEALVGLN